MSKYIAVAKLSDLDPERGTTIQVKGRLIALFRQEDGVRAIDDSCPHMGASLATGYVCDGVVTCPWHAWRFRIEDGCWVDAPGSGTKVQTYTTKIEADDVLLDVDW